MDENITCFSSLDFIFKNLIKKIKKVKSVPDWYPSSEESSSDNSI